MSVTRYNVALWAVTVAPLTLLSTPAWAGETEGPAAGNPSEDRGSALPIEGSRLPSPADIAEGAGGGWEVSVTPYIWFSGLDGDVGVFPAVPPVQVDMSFGDVIENFKFGAMVGLAARKDRFVAMADVSYIDLGTSKDVGIADPSFTAIDLDVDTFTATALAGYRAVDQGGTSLDLMGGVRVSIVDTQLELIGPARTLVGDSNEGWVDPVVATRFHTPLGGNWSMNLYGDVGGFGVGSDVTWQLLGTVQVEMGSSWRIGAGWRYYAIDYDEGGFIYDVAMNGPIIGATFDF